MRATRGGHGSCPCSRRPTRTPAFRPPERLELAALARARYVDPTVGWRLFDDSLPALERLGEAGWRHVILSNHVPELGQLVSGLGLDRHIETVLCSAVTGYEKPHPEAFAAAVGVRRNGEPVWMVGDNPVADVEGARRRLAALLVRRNGSACSTPRRRSSPRERRLLAHGRDRGTRAVAIGTFDGVHRGHKRVIDAALAAGPTPTVVTFDRIRGSRSANQVELLTTSSAGSSCSRRSVSPTRW